MEKDQVVELMTETIIALNVELAHQNNISQEEIDKAIESTKPQLMSVNRVLYEVLKVNGIIQ
jgi:transcriptional/translational regulatory protein YebC/TACO1